MMAETLNKLHENQDRQDSEKTNLDGEPAVTILPGETKKLKFTLLHGNSEDGSIRFTPTALRPGESLFWALKQDVTVIRKKGAKYSIPAGTVVASIIVGIAHQVPTIDQSMKEAGAAACTHHLLLRFDSLTQNEFPVTANNTAIVPAPGRKMKKGETLQAPEITLAASPIELEPVTVSDIFSGVFPDNLNQIKNVQETRVFVPLTDQIPWPILEELFAEDRNWGANLFNSISTRYHSWVDHASFGIVCRQGTTMENLDSTMAGDIEDPVIKGQFVLRLIQDDDLGVDRLNQHH